MGGHIHPPTNSCWEGCSPFVLRRESKGSWAKIRGSQGVVWGGLGYMGKAWDPQQSLKIKNYLGTWEGWSGEKMLGPSELAPTAAPPSVVGVTPRQMTCDCTIRGRKPGSGTSSSYLTMDKLLSSWPGLCPVRVLAALNPCGTQFSLALSCMQWEEGVQTQQGQTAGVPFSKEGLGSRGETAGRERGYH